MNHGNIKNNYRPILMLNTILIILCFYNCSSAQNIQTSENRDLENISLFGEWTVDATKTLEVNDRINHSKIVFEEDENVSKEMQRSLEGLEKKDQLNLGISDMATLSFLESGYMVQFPTTCASNSEKVAPKIPYCVFTNLINERIILFSVPEGPNFLSMPLVMECNFLYLRLNPKEKLFLRKKSTKPMILPTAYTNDLEIENLKGKVKSITSYTYDGSTFERSPYGNIQKISKESFDEFGNYQTSKTNSFRYRTMELTITYSGSFHNRTITQLTTGNSSAYSKTQVVKGTNIITYTSRDTIEQSLNELGVQEIISSQYQKIQYLDYQDNVIKINLNSKDGGIYSTQYEYSNFDKQNNWLKQISYDITHCKHKRDGVTIRMIEYY